MYEIYKQLRDARNVTDYAVAKACGFKQSTFTEWEKKAQGKAGQAPKTDKLLKIARFFGVSLDYLVTGENFDGTVPLILTPIEKELLSVFRELNEDGQIKTLDYTNDLAATRLYIKRDLYEQMDA